MEREQRKQRIKAYGMLVDAMHILKELPNVQYETEILDEFLEFCLEIYGTEMEFTKNDALYLSYFGGD